MTNNVKKIPLKNYILVIIISIFTILILGYFVFWYKSNEKFYMENSVMSGYLSEINEESAIENLSNYVLDNPDTFLYVSFGNDSTVKDFELKFKDFIKTENIRSNFIYLDLNLINDKKFIINIKNSFFSEELKNNEISLEKQSNIFVFKNGKIIDVLYTSKQTINLFDVNRFLIKYGAIEND